MMDNNGRRKYRIDGPFGKLPTEKYVKSWFARRKKNGAKVFASGSNTDRFSCMSIDELRDEFEKTFDCAPTRKILCLKLLEIDDQLKYEGHDNEYAGLKVDELVEECKNWNSPFVVGSNGLQMVLRSHSTLLNCTNNKSSIEYNNAVNITNAAEEILSQRKK